jgi:hypothetical protein
MSNGNNSKPNRRWEIGVESLMVPSKNQPRPVEMLAEERKSRNVTENDSVYRRAMMSIRDRSRTSTINRTIAYSTNPLRLWPATTLKGTLWWVRINIGHEQV